jgi:hypothetical protein
VILASGYGVDAELQGVIQKHQAHFLQKPFDKDQLRLALTNSRLPFA